MKNIVLAVTIYLILLLNVLLVAGQFRDHDEPVCSIDHEVGVCSNAQDPTLSTHLKIKAVCVQTGAFINGRPQGKCVPLENLSEQVPDMYCCFTSSAPAVGYYHFRDVSYMTDSTLLSLSTDAGISCSAGAMIDYHMCSSSVDHDADGYCLGSGCDVSDRDCNDNAYFCRSECDDINPVEGCFDFCNDEDNDGACAPTNLRPSSSELSAAEWGIPAVNDYFDTIDDFYYANFRVEADKVRYTDFVPCDDPSCSRTAAYPNCCCCHDAASEECCDTTNRADGPCGDRPTYINSTEPFRYCGVLRSGEIAGQPFDDVFYSPNPDPWIAERKWFDIPFDCDDADANIDPFTPEGESEGSCNMIDDDCDGEIDECSPFIPEGYMNRQYKFNYDYPPLEEPERRDEDDADDTDDADDDWIDWEGPVVVLGGPVPESLYIEETGRAMGWITGKATGEDADTVEDDIVVQPQERRCIYSGPFSGCQILDYDGDGYKNFIFRCPDCNDCDDHNVSINPGADDEDPNGPTTPDMNCNGFAGDTLDSDSDGIPDIFDQCNSNPGTNPYGHDGCEYIVDDAGSNIPGWSN